MKNYAAIILALTAYDLSGQAIVPRFLFEPVIRPLDYRPPEDYNASRGRGSHHGTNNRVTPSVFGSIASTDYNRTAVDFTYSHDYNDGTYDQNSSTYNMSGGVIYHGSDVPLKSLLVGNARNSLNERWHTPYSPDVVQQNLDRFTPPDNRYNPNLTLHGDLVESPWDFFSAPQISMADRQNNLRDPMGLMRTDGSGPHTRGQRLSTLNWDTLGHDIDGFNDPTGYDARMERIDAIEMGGFFQDGQANAHSGNTTVWCDGHRPQGNPQVPTLFHLWETRHFSSMSRAGLDAKRSIPLDGIYAYIAGAGQHDFDFSGGADIRKRRHWDWKQGNTGNKPVFNVGWCLDSDGFFVPLTECEYTNLMWVPGIFYYTVFGVVKDNEKYSPGADHSQNVGNDTNSSDVGGPYFGNPYRVTGTTSQFSLNGGNAIYARSEMEIAQDATKTELAGHPVEMGGSSLSPWDEAFGYDLSRFFGDFYVEPSVWSSNVNDDATTGTGLAAARVAGSADFQNPLDKNNQISTRSLDDVLKMGDMRTKIRHINRFPGSGLDYLFRSTFIGPQGATPIVTQ